jgi:hypothetical protein
MTKCMWPPARGTSHSRIMGINMDLVPPLLPLFLLQQTVQLVLCTGAGSVLLASAKPRSPVWTARGWSVIHHAKEHVSTAPESNGGELYTTPANAWHCAWLSQACMRLGSECCNFSTRRSCSVSLCGLPLCRWAVVAPRRFHFTITALTVDWAALAGQKLNKPTGWKGDILWLCHVESHFTSTANVCLWKLHICVHDSITPSATGEAEIAESTHLKGCPHTFVYII